MKTIKFPFYIKEGTKAKGTWRTGSGGKYLGPERIRIESRK